MLRYANHTPTFLSENSQCDDVGVGCFHGDGQRVLTRLVSGVLIGSSPQEQTHLTARTNEKQPSVLVSSRWRESFISDVRNAMARQWCTTRCAQRWRQRAAPPDPSGPGG